MRTLKDGIMRKMGKWKVSKFVELFFCPKKNGKKILQIYTPVRAH